LKTNYYQVFGLVVQSELVLPELNTIDQAKPDIIIRIGPTPGKLEKVSFRGAIFESSPEEFLFSNDIVKLHIKDGKTICFQPNDTASDQEIRLYILGTGLGVILHQRGLLPIHGSSIAHNGRAYIFSGISTSGKSSLAAAFALKGYKVLADDISVVKKDKNGIFMVHPGIPHIKIWNDVQSVLNFPEVTERVRPQLEKYFLSHQIEFYNEPLPIAAICVLNIKRDKGFEYSKITGVDKFNSLRNNTFRIRILDSIGQTQAHFQTISQLANSIDLYSICRPSIPLNINELADFVEKNIVLANEYRK
jgi:hypothetical protein